MMKIIREGIYEYNLHLYIFQWYIFFILMLTWIKLGHAATSGWTMLWRGKWDFYNIFESPNPGLSVCCVQVREEAKRWEKWHEDALEGSFTNRKGRKEVSLQDVPQDFKGWEPMKRRGKEQEVKLVRGTRWEFFYVLILLKFIIDFLIHLWICQGSGA